MAEKEKILVIDGQFDERAALVEGALQPFGYQVRSTGSGDDGLSLILAETPDCILLDLHVEGLSALDIMAALAAQSLDVPVIAIANAGEEKQVLNAFRIGARDYLFRPLRDAEVIQTLERSLKELRLRRERESLAREVRAADAQARDHLREVRALMGVGQAVAAQRPLDQVTDLVLRAAETLTQADSVGLLVKEGDKLILKAGHNLEKGLIERVGEDVQDSLAAVVMTSGDVFLGSGSALEKYSRLHREAASVIYAPLMIQGQGLGVLWLANRETLFKTEATPIATALADYAALAVHQAQAAALPTEIGPEDDTVTLKRTPPVPMELDKNQISGMELALRLQAPLQQLLANMNLFRTGEMGRLTASQQAAVDVMHRQFDSLIRLVNGMVPPTE